MKENEPIHPAPYTNQDGSIQHDVYFGLTTRDHFAALAMQSFILHPNLSCTDVSDISKFSVSMADALMDELYKKTP